MDDIGVPPSKAIKNEKKHHVYVQDDDGETEVPAMVGSMSGEHQELASERGGAAYQNTEGVTMALLRPGTQIPKPQSPSAPTALPPQNVGHTSRNNSIRKDTTDSATTDKTKAAAPPCSQVAGSVGGGTPLQVTGLKREMNNGNADGGEEAPEPDSLAAGRTKRMRKSTLVFVNGQPVLKRNMYDLNAGEPSVFDREQAKGSGDAAYLKSQGVTLAAPRPKLQIPKPRAPSAPKLLPPLQVARKSHNESIRKDAEADIVTRALYLSGHLDKLRHFVPASVIAAIRSKAATAPVGWKAPDPITQQPRCITGTLKEYQLDGLAWMVSKFHNGVNAILADEMGLGKTLQTIALLAHLKELNIAGPHLVVVPLSVLPSWMAEFKKWCPSFRVVRLHCNDADEREKMRKEILCNPDSFDVAVTTYDTIKNPKLGEALKHSITWRYVVLDEAHKVKNEDSLISIAMRKINRQHTLMLTGTPVQNNLHELFALLNFMYPDVFTSSDMFDSAFDLTAQIVDDSKLEAAHFLLRPFLLRRIKDEVDIKLPPKLETKINCPLSEMQTFWYRRLLMREGKLLMDFEATEQAKGAIKFSSDGGAWQRMLNLLMQLRKVCNHPYMFPDAEPDFDGVSTNEDIVEASGKMQVLDRMLVKLKANGHRVVLFSQFNLMLNVVEDYLIMRGYKYRRLDGSTNRIQRMIDIDQFNKPNSDIFIYILNTRAGGLGVNLQTADTCVLVDSDFNPQCDLQAMARVHRIGQTKPVHIYRLISDGTVEDRVQKRAESKLYLDQMVNRGSTAGAEELEGLSKKDLFSMLRFGADRIFKNESGTIPTDADLDAIMDRSKMMEISLLPKAVAPAGTQTPATTSTTGPDIASTSAAGPVSSAAMLVDSKHTALSFDAEQAPVSILLFGGKDYKALRAQAGKGGDSFRDIAKQWDAKRTRKERLISIDGYDVLRENNYSIEEGGISIGIKTVKKEKNAGKDYTHSDHCQVCWKGGRLLGCGHCPASYHPRCLGLAANTASNGLCDPHRDNHTCTCRRSCPQHSCRTCDRKTSAAGGMLFRCDTCKDAYCEDHVPNAYNMVGENILFQALGQIHPRSACYITCTDECKKSKNQMADFINRVVTERTDDYEERMKTQRADAAAQKAMLQKPKVVPSAH